MNTVRVGLRLAIALGVVLSAGCASIAEKEYACSGRPDGFTCKSAVEVYELTDSHAWKEELEAVRNGTDTAVVTASYAAMAPLPEMNTGAIPLRTPARVMRVWVAPWEDELGDLHMPGLVYTEVENRRWQVGLPQPDGRNSLRPLQAR